MGVFTAMGISASGLRAERMRMDVTASNIANVETTRTPEGGPYRRRQVVLQSASGSSAAVAVQVMAVEPEPGPPARVHMPGHPDADSEGYVLVPNIEMPLEMADLIVAARAYEANAAAFRAGRDLIRQALSILA